MKTFLYLLILTSWCVLGVSSQCPQGWVKSNTYCYYFNNNDTVTWSEAKSECRMRLGALLRIETLDEWNFIKSNMAINPSGNGFWTDLNDRDNTAADPDTQGTGTWLWGSDEYPLKSIVQAHWDTEPDNNDAEDCIAINIAATLSDEHCGSKRGFICEVDNTGGLCPMYWLMGPNDCFFVSNVSDPTQLLTWDQANTKCQNMDTGGQGKPHLVTLDNQADSSFFAINMPSGWSIQTTQLWWTDLTDRNSEGHYYWANNDVYNPNYVNWTKQPDDIAGREHCGTILQAGTFSDRDCKQQNNYICRKEIPGQTYTSKFGCGDWLRAGHKCYQVYSKPLKTWPNAKSYCSSIGGRLMKIDNADEMNWLSYQTQTAKMSYGGYWIGLSDTSRRWRWTDGQLANTELLKWNQEPNDFSGSQDCGAIGTDGVFSDWNCKNFRNGFICEKPQRSSNCQTGWVANSQRCYYIGSKWVTFQEAIDKCIKLSGDGTGALLAVNTQAEMDFVLSQLDKLTKAPFWFWTSLTDVIHEGLWQYTNPADNTATALGLVQWNSEPNNWHGEEHCVATAFGGRLNDAKCGTASGFICEKYAAGYGGALPTLPLSKLALTLIALVTIVTTRLH